ncbi:flagellar hook assembly protein FlgD [Vibrio diabolicus]|jgi:flagellar basal-body rod modification protein FlgD|uniref:Basal-body rod modification protein FlgD n=6 Tax=Gammaproteobacteria TaxID=1236 RepID=A0A0T7EV81_9VIBR|nr:MULTISPECIES: flagellar hook assembly protein FlgD [Vibrio]EGQ9180948.1 flagellar hook assembly protein FlgD [Vibrio alginolyticus]KOY46454.1 flagellar biosynthesis protein FlgD [Vibrio parahaemolyticus]MEA3482480.1 flagellar hook assembly protein FlgD [Pseudomonadota bacterium]GAJ78482.1 flagellar basal-body rod modification protein FlgD [Vibrio sp. JCM 18905]ACY52329.1 flagellar basal-body rod modification protein FlgD [Vibrio antiquarius]
MAGINNVGQSGLSYIDQLKSLQESNKKTEESTGKQDLKQEDFLSLLTKQLSQQDPFKPVSNDQMIAQMASFATVDGIGKMNTQFESLNSSMTSNQALQASSLVGRDVLVPGAAGVKQDDAPMAAMVKLSQSIDNLFVRVEDEAGQLVRTFEVGAKPAGDTRVLWDGKDESGNPLPAGKYKVKASGLVEGESQEFPVSTYANVNSVLLGKGDGNVLLNLAGFESPVRLAEVLEVGKA